LHRYHPAPSRLSLARTSPRIVCALRQHAVAFNQPVKFDTSKITSMNGMFEVRSTRTSLQY
tara:strand:- start:1223 stop:1405 length:183 start_codon:yes stop_codon:yes gene_type:complete